MYNVDYITKNGFTYDEKCLLWYFYGYASINSMAWHIKRASKDAGVEKTWNECKEFLSELRTEFINTRSF